MQAHLLRREVRLVLLASPRRLRPATPAAASHLEDALYTPGEHATQVLEDHARDEVRTKRRLRSDKLCLRVQVATPWCAARGTWARNSVLVVECFAYKVSLLCSALYAKFPRCLVLYKQSILIM